LIAPSGGKRDCRLPIATSICRSGRKSLFSVGQRHAARCRACTNDARCAAGYPTSAKARCAHPPRRLTAYPRGVESTSQPQRP
jgi:hypothetical protein